MTRLHKFSVNISIVIFSVGKKLRKPLTQLSKESNFIIIPLDVVVVIQQKKNTSPIAGGLK
jgi:hypothetical protein